MIIKQISVFLENRSGALAEVLGVLRENNVNLRALSVADTADFDILRLVVKESDLVERVLRDANFAVKTTPVLGIRVTDRPGGLLAEIDKLTAANINIEYAYAFANSSTDEARVVLKVDELETAEQVLRISGTKVAEEESPNFEW